MTCNLCRKDKREYQSARSPKLAEEFAVCHDCARERLEKCNAPAACHYGAVEQEAKQCVRDLRDAALRRERTAVRKYMGRDLPALRRL